MGYITKNFKQAKMYMDYLANGFGHYPVFAKQPFFYSQSLQDIFGEEAVFKYNDNKINTGEIFIMLKS